MRESLQSCENLEFRLQGPNFLEESMKSALRIFAVIALFASMAVAEAPMPKPLPPPPDTVQNL
jgi:hypothetical protein